MAFPNELLQRMLLQAKKLGNAVYTYYLGGIDILHQNVHENRIWTATVLKLGVTTTNYLDVRVKTNAKSCHLRYVIIAEGKCYSQTYANTTFTANGTAYNPFNRVVNSSAVVSTQIFVDPTINAIGTQRANDLINGGTGGNAAGGSYNNEFESIIPANTEFLIRIQNVSGQTRDIEIELNFYEVE